MDGLPDTEGTDDTDTEGTNFLSGEVSVNKNEYTHTLRTVLPFLMGNVEGISTDYNIKSLQSV